jgi:hypothetical protein
MSPSNSNANANVSKMNAGNANASKMNAGKMNAGMNTNVGKGNANTNAGKGNAGNANAGKGNAGMNANAKANVNASMNAGNAGNAGNSSVMGSNTSIFDNTAAPLEGGKRGAKKSYKVSTTDKGVPVPSTIFHNKDIYSAARKAGTAIMKRVPNKKKHVTFTLKDLKSGKELIYTVTRSATKETYVAEGKTIPVKVITVKSCKTSPN